MLQAAGAGGGGVPKKKSKVLGAKSASSQQRSQVKQKNRAIRMPEPTSLGTIAELKGIRENPRPKRLDSKNITNEEWLRLHKEYRDRVEATRKKALKKFSKT